MVELAPPRHEPADVTPRLAGSLALLAAGIAALLAFGVSVFFPAALVTPPRFDPAKVFPTPRLQSSPRSDMAKFRAQEMQRLTQYGWVDRAHGIVHIPIDAAMADVAHDGIPDWPAAR